MFISGSLMKKEFYIIQATDLNANPQMFINPVRFNLEPKPLTGIRHHSYRIHEEILLLFGVIHSHPTECYDLLTFKFKQIAY